ncbi:MAG: hypothetical protein SPL39_02420 [Selenomonadaceae bacterium]|nr:hypothetical protein [Selenomonadaceae bacterium]
MRNDGERGVSSLFGLAMLGIMLLAAMGLLAVERNESYATHQYESEVRLRLAAQSEAERAALQFEQHGKRAGMTEDSLASAPDVKDGKWEVACDTRDDGVAYRVMAYFEPGVRSNDHELMIAATTWFATEEFHFPLVKSYVRVRAHLVKSKEGEYYVWLGWVP